MAEGDLTGTWRNYLLAAGVVGLENLEPGVAGALAGGFAYTFSTNLEATDPGAGKFKFDKAIAEATSLRISETDKNGNALAAFLATLDDSTNTVKGSLVLTKVGEPKAFAIFNVTGALVDAGTWDSIAVTYVTGPGFANNDEVVVEFVRAGDKGEDGKEGKAGSEGRQPGLHYTWLTSKEGEPAAGQAKKFVLTEFLTLSNTDKDGNAVKAFLSTWDDSTTTANRGTIIIRQVGAPKRFLVLKIKAASTEEATCTLFTVAVVSEGEALENEKEVTIEWARTGDTGAKGEAASGIVCRLATTAALPANTRAENTLTANANGALGNIDGAKAAVNDLILVKNEGTGANRGVYKVTSIGGEASKWTMVRDERMDESAELVAGMTIAVGAGTVNGSTIWQLTNSGATINVTTLNFARPETQTAPLARPNEYPAWGHLGSASVVPGERTCYFFPITIPRRLSPVPTFIEYVVGATSSGEVTAALFEYASSAGEAVNIISNKAKAAQAAANTPQRIPITVTPTALEPGNYVIAIMLSSATGTWWGATRFMRPVLTEKPVAFEIPTVGLLMPTTPGTIEKVPFVSIL